MLVDYQHCSHNALRTFPEPEDCFRIVVIFTNPNDGNPVPVALEVNDTRYPVGEVDENDPDEA